MAGGLPGSLWDTYPPNFEHHTPPPTRKARWRVAIYRTERLCLGASHTTQQRCLSRYDGCYRATFPDQKVRGVFARTSTMDHKTDSSLGLPVDHDDDRPVAGWLGVGALHLVRAVSRCLFAFD